jgi:hypothetical protein
VKQDINSVGIHSNFFLDKISSFCEKKKDQQHQQMIFWGKNGLYLLDFELKKIKLQDFSTIGSSR